MLVWVGRWEGRREGGGSGRRGRRLECSIAASTSFTFQYSHQPLPTYTTRTGGKEKMKKRPRPTSSSSSIRSTNDLVSSSMARVASLAGGPSDDAVARLIALEVGNWTGRRGW